MSLSHRKNDITLYAKMLNVLKNITEIMLSRILAECLVANFFCENSADICQPIFSADFRP